MKKVVLVLCVLFLAELSYSQLPNGGFETWSSETQPDGWKTSNVFGVLTNVTKSGDAHTGSFALKGQTIQFGEELVLPGLYLGEAAQGMTVNGKISSVSGYYKFFPQGGDILMINIYAASSSGFIGSGFIEYDAQADSYQYFDIEIEYWVEEDPTLLYITIVASDPNLEDDIDGHLNTYFLIDDISLGGVTDVKNIVNLAETFDLYQNYPNPFNPSTIIEYSVPYESRITLKIYDIIGREIEALVSGEIKSTGRYQAVWNPVNLNSGIYFCRIETSKGASTIKMSYLK